MKTVTTRPKNRDGIAVLSSTFVTVSVTSLFYHIHFAYGGSNDA